MTTMPNIVPRSRLGGRLSRHRSADPLIFSPRADERLQAGAAAKGRARRAVLDLAGDWPPNSPAAVNAWLLLVTTKPPTWHDNLVLWEDHPPSLGRANEGFYYPDPLGFWAEIRRWSLKLFQLQYPRWGPPDALALTTLLHLGDDGDRLSRAIELSEPQMMLFLSTSRRGCAPAFRFARWPTTSTILIAPVRCTKAFGGGQPMAEWWARLPSTPPPTTCTGTTT